MLRIYEQDAYVFEFEGTVTSVDGDWVSLNATAFYPGGGGQVNDTGRICGLEVTDVKVKGDDVVHRVPGHGMKVGDDVWCSVDWDRRYDLMMGHTAEHLLFSGLRRAVPDIGIVKIFISPESKYVVVDRDIPWDGIMKAQEFVNAAIADNLSVMRSTMDKDDPDIENVRAKLERIDGDVITVVEIGDADVAACGGLHVRETEEISAVLVDRKVSAGKDGYAIHFRVGRDAVKRSMELANKCLQMVDAMGTKPEDAVKAAQNLKHQNGIMSGQLGNALRRMINDLSPEIVNGISVYSGIFEINDKDVITEAFEQMRGAGAVSVIVAKGDALSVYMSSGVKNADCSEILKRTVSKYGGRGGGKAEYAQGGVPDTADAGHVLHDMLDCVRNALKREN